MGEQQFLFWAIGLGAISAASLPLGSIFGLCLSPSNRALGAMTAYGSGALIAALAVELIAPTALHLGHTNTLETHREAAHHLITMLLGALSGGVVFVLLDQAINSQGGFLRKTSAIISHFSSQKTARRKQIVEHLGASKMIRGLPLEMVEEIVDKIKEKSVVKGERIFDEGDDGHALYFIELGKINITRENQHIASLESGDAFGEVSMVTNERRTATAVAGEDSLLLVLDKEDFNNLREKSVDLDHNTQRLAAERLKELAENESMDEDGEKWVRQAIDNLAETAVIPTAAELQKAEDEYTGAPMAIWLGILLDGIPESFVIGTAVFSSISVAIMETGAESVTFWGLVPFTLIAGLFLANFPEALSSSIGMKKLGWSNRKVFLMWFSLLILTAVGAGFGYWLGGSIDHNTVVFIEGLAAGAMLTMIAAAMIPEAVHLAGGNLVGLTTLGGFLSAVSFKLIE